MQIKLVIFDLDNTLTPSKCDPHPDMVERLERLLETRWVAVISGCKWEQFLRQLVGFIDPSLYPRLIIVPVSGGQVLRWQREDWGLVAETPRGISFDQIVTAFEQSFAACGFERPEQTWGPQFEDRICQVTFSALGQEAPHEAKKNWDPDFSKRRPLVAEISRRLPSLLVRAGGATSIDVSGFEKDHGLNQVIEHMQAEGITEDNTLFIGDAIFPGGNDYAVVKTDIRYLQTRSLEDTQSIITELLTAEPAVLARARRGPPTDGSAAGQSAP